LAAIHLDFSETQDVLWVFTQIRSLNNLNNYWVISTVKTTADELFAVKSDSIWKKQ